MIYGIGSTPMMNIGSARGAVAGTCVVIIRFTAPRMNYWSWKKRRIEISCVR